LLLALTSSRLAEKSACTLQDFVLQSAPQYHDPSSTTVKDLKSQDPGQRLELQTHFRVSKGKRLLKLAVLIAITHQSFSVSGLPTGVLPWFDVWGRRGRIV